MRRFSKIEIDRWRQFDSVSIDLDTQLCVLTGVNGCGKTTILNLLGRHFGWNINFVSTPHLSEKKERKFWSDVYKQRLEEVASTGDSVRIGKISYDPNGECQLFAPKMGQGTNYTPTFSNQLAVEGIHIPSHRPVTSYANIENIPLDPKNNEQHFLEFQQLLFQTYGSPKAGNPGLSLKKSLISLALFGYGNEAVTADFEYRMLFEGFQEILRKLLPKSIGFQRFEIRKPDIVLITDTGDFLLDAMSGGVSAVMSMAWQIHMYGANKTHCTVIIDEPENHLHPSMQREFLPSLIKAFPSYRFIISTHSPFVVSSSPEAYVYALIFNDVKKIISHKIESADLSASPNKLLRDILGVPTTVPLWVEEKIANLLSGYQNMEATPENVNRLHGELKALGLDTAVSEFSGRKN